MIEIGEYVRTKDGIIDKVIIDYKGKCNNPNCNYKHISCESNYYNEHDIVKHSKNLIDLIEVGDYVNRYKIEEVSNGEIIIYDKGMRMTISDYNQEVIKTILTKEQFSQNSYKVEE